MVCYDALTSSLIRMGFKMSKCDNSLLVLHNIGVTIYVLIYVDYLIITDCDKTLIQHVVTSLSKKHSLKYLRLLHYFLDVEVYMNASGFFLS